MRKYEQQLWAKYYELQHMYDVAKDDSSVSKIELEQLRDNVDMVLDSLQDIDADIDKEMA